MTATGLSRFLIPFIAAGLVLPPPAHALRIRSGGAEEGTPATGALEESLLPGSRGLEEQLSRDFAEFSRAAAERFVYFHGPNEGREAERDAIFLHYGDANVVRSDAGDVTPLTLLYKLVARDLPATVAELEGRRVRESARQMSSWADAAMNALRWIAERHGDPEPLDRALDTIGTDEAEEAFREFSESARVGAMELELELPAGRGGPYLRWLFNLAKECLAFRQRMNDAYYARLRVPSDEDVTAAVAALGGAPAQQLEAISRIREYWRIGPETPGRRELYAALLRILHESTSEAAEQRVPDRASTALYRLSEFLPAGAARQEFALQVLNVYLAHATGFRPGYGTRIEIQDELVKLLAFLHAEGFYTDQLYNLARRARGLRIGATFEPSDRTDMVVAVNRSSDGEGVNFPPIEEGRARRVSFVVPPEVAARFGLARAGTWPGVPARNAGDILGYFEAAGLLPDEEQPPPGRLCASLGAGRTVMEAVAAGTVQVLVNGAPLSGTTAFPIGAVVELRLAGLEALEWDKLVTPEAAARLAEEGFTGLDGGRILVDPARLRAVPARAFLHEGLTEPPGLSDIAVIVPMAAGSPAQAGDFLRGQRADGRDVIFANLSVLTPADVAAAAAEAASPPGIVGLMPGARITAAEALALAALCQRIGPVYILEVSQIVSRTGEVLLLLRSA